MQVLFQLLVLFNYFILKHNDIILFTSNFSANKNIIDQTVDALIKEDLSPSQVQVIQKDETAKRKKEDISTENNSISK